MRILTELDHERYQEFILPEIIEFPRSFGITPEETRRFPFSVGSNSDGFTIGEFDGERLIAAAKINRIQQRSRRAHVAWLNRMVVARDYRRLGHGRRVLDAAVDQARELQGLE